MASVADPLPSAADPLPILTIARALLPFPSPTRQPVNSGVDFHLPNEILAVIPTDPYEQLDVARKITSMAIALRRRSLSPPLPVTSISGPHPSAPTPPPAAGHTTLSHHGAVLFLLCRWK